MKMFAVVMYDKNTEHYVGVATVFPAEELDRMTAALRNLNEDGEQPFVYDIEHVSFDDYKTMIDP